MATAGEEDVEYDSDPEEAKRSLAMRRREASDDEEGEGDGRDKGADRRVGIHSDDSDDQGGVAEYDDEEDLDGDEEVVEEGDDVEEEVYEEREGDRGFHGADVEGSAGMVKESDGGARAPSEAELPSENRDDEEKKENEPFAVPTAGAFYMHDDRFRDNAGGRHRRIHGGRRLWESKDDKKWGHDKFEEMTLQERRYEEGRRVSKGNFRGRGKNRVVARGGFVRGNKKGYSNSGNQSQLPKRAVRGRGSRRYEPINKNNGPASQTQNKQSERSLEKNSQLSSGRTMTPAPTVESDSVSLRKQAFASNLNSASPPFYPSGSSIKEGNVTPKRDVQAGSTSRNVRPGVRDEGFSVQPNSAMLRGKNIADPISMDKLYIDESISSAAGKPLNNMHIPSSGVNSSQSSQPRAPGRGVSIPVSMNYQPVPSLNQVPKVSPTQATHRNSTAGRTQSSQQAPTPPLNHRPGNGSQASSPPKTSVAVSSSDSGDMDATSESGKFKGAIVGKGKGGAQSSGRGSFVYGGAQVMGASGNMSASPGDQNFPATPAFLPVMQFGAQHSGGLGVPAVGMAFPGYVAQPQLGLGNNEMTWLPVLAGAAGALGTTYCPPYLAVDGAYHARQSGQTSSLGTPSKENNTSKANSEWNPPQRTELVNDEFGQRQNKPRRYSEMNFGQ
ncbi:protein MLN51 homolog isoform X2 [Neltuma alba]|uniref:protein MLN51 homolog isoform X2 n=1 Tax=Neltuma alba TaxID=207710 RepID=UPI0010A51E52|nr:protein MLN51 homolog isoform X2 [Prosopis alba]